MRTSILAVSASLIGIGLVTAGPVGTQSNSRTPLVRMAKQYARIQSIHFRSHAQVALHQRDENAERSDAGLAGVVTMEYWAQGNRYRIDAHSSEQLGLADDWKIAYDGNRFQLLEPNNMVLSIQKEDPQRLPVAFPNPLFLPVDYLSEDDDTCDGCMLRLHQVAGRAAIAEKAVAGADGQSTALAASEFEMQGGIVGGQKLSLRIRMSVSPGETVPIEIQRLLPDGRVRSAVYLDDYRAAAPGVVLPRTIAVEAFNDYGARAARIDYAFDILEVNTPIDASVFTFDWKPVRSVWDSDARVFLKQRGLSTPAAERQSTGGLLRGRAAQHYLVRRGE